MAIIFDDMYIKEDLVYNKHTNALIGFANLCDTNTHLLAFQKSLQAPVTHSIKVEELAKTMMVFMVRGLYSRLAIFVCTIPMFYGHRRFTFSAIVGSNQASRVFRP